METTSLLLRAPSANRVYTAAAGPLARAEARWVLGAHLGTAPAVHERRVGGMDALEIQASELAGDEGARLLGSLSATLGVLDLLEDDPETPVLRPRNPPDLFRHPADLETILKYPGKTNEQFTALLVNLAAALSTRRSGLFDGSLSLLDPLCGRGTTVNRALRLGLSPVGADLDRTDHEAYRAFLSTWLRDHRYKHTVSATTLTVHGERLGPRLDVEFAADKQTLRAGHGQSLTLLGCDTTRLGQLLPARSVDALVADLPYGVQHGARADGTWQRSPREVLRSAADGWRRLLRDGGGLALAVNRRTLDHDTADEVLAAAGFRLLSSDGAFRHRVDRSIDRDVLLAVPTDHPQLEQLSALDAHQETDRP